MYRDSRVISTSLISGAICNFNSMIFVNLPSSGEPSIFIEISLPLVSHTLTRLLLSSQARDANIQKTISIYSYIFDIMEIQNNVRKKKTVIIYIDADSYFYFSDIFLSLSLKTLERKYRIHLQCCFMRVLLKKKMYLIILFNDVIYYLLYTKKRSF